MDNEAVPSTVREGAKVVVVFEAVDHGVEHEQFFQGCGVSHTDFEDVSTGTGATGREAFRVARGALAGAGWDVGNIPLLEAPEGAMERVFCETCKGEGFINPEREDADPCADCDGQGEEYPEDSHYYVSIRVRGPRERIECFTAQAMAEAKRGKAKRLKGRIDAALRHERNVDLVLESAKHELGNEARLEIEDALTEVELSL